MKILGIIKFVLRVRENLSVRPGTSDTALIGLLQYLRNKRYDEEFKKQVEGVEAFKEKSKTSHVMCIRIIRAPQRNF